MHSIRPDVKRVVQGASYDHGSAHDARTLEGQVELREQFERPIEPPFGVVLMDDDERKLWDSIVSCKPREAWTPVTLLLVGELVAALRFKKRLEIEEMQNTPVFVFSGAGNLIPHPVYALYDKQVAKIANLAVKCGLAGLAMMVDTASKAAHARANAEHQMLTEATTGIKGLLA